MSTENTGKFAKEFDNYVISTGNGNTIPAPKSYLEFSSLYSLVLFFLTYFEQLQDNAMGNYLKTKFGSYHKMLLELYDMYQKNSKQEYMYLTMERHFNTKIHIPNYYPSRDQLVNAMTDRRFALGGTLGMVKNFRNTQLLIVPMKLFRVQVFEMIHSFYSPKDEKLDPKNAVYKIGTTIKSSKEFSEFASHMMNVYNEVRTCSTKLDDLDLLEFENILTEAVNIAFEEQKEKYKNRQVQVQEREHEHEQEQEHDPDSTPALDSEPMHTQHRVYRGRGRGNYRGRGRGSYRGRGGYVKQENYS